MKKINSKNHFRCQMAPSHFSAIMTPKKKIQYTQICFIIVLFHFFFIGKLFFQMPAFPEEMLNANLPDRPPSIR